MAKTHGGLRRRGTKPRSWHPVKVSNSHFSVVGGLCNKPHLVKTLEIETSRGPKHFVQVTRNQRWLVQCAAGTLAGKGTLKRIKALSRLRLALHTAAYRVTCFLWCILTARRDTQLPSAVVLGTGNVGLVEFPPVSGP